MRGIGLITILLACYPAAAHQSAIGAGLHQHFFYSATAQIAGEAGYSLHLRVFGSSEFAERNHVAMERWFLGTSRLLGQLTFIPWGNDATASRRCMGAAAPSGHGFASKSRASQVGLEGSTLAVWRSPLYDGRATWDNAGKSSATSIVTVDQCRRWPVVAPIPPVAVTNSRQRWQSRTTGGSTECRHRHQQRVGLPIIVVGTNSSGIAD